MQLALAGKISISLRTPKATFHQVEYFLLVEWCLFVTSLWDIHHKNIKTDIKFTQILFILSFISMIFCCIGVLISLYKPSSKEEVNLAFLAVFISLLALTSSACYLLLTNHMQFKIYLNEDKIRQKQDELRNIRESI